MMRTERGQNNRRRAQARGGASLARRPKKPKAVRITSTLPTLVHSRHANTDEPLAIQTRSEDKGREKQAERQPNKVKEDRVPPLPDGKDRKRNRAWQP